MRRVQGQHAATDTREAIKIAGMELVAGGLDKLTMQDAALRAGYSKAAPYQLKFFKEHKLAGLYAVVAEGGFERLRGALERTASWNRSPREQVLELAVAYVLFARDNPHLYSVMFSAPVADKGRFPELGIEVARIYELMHEALGRFRQCPAAEREDRTLAVSLLLHGWASELINEWIVTAADDDFIRRKTRRYVAFLIDT